jgi:putative ABC transport system substrate-binding protein
MNRPGGNVTGVSFFSELAGAETPRDSRAAQLHWHPGPTRAAAPNFADSEIIATDAQSAARSLGRNLVVLNASTDRDLDAAFATLVERKVGVLQVSPDPFFLSRRDRLVGLAARHRLPAIYQLRDFVMAGGLNSYGTNIADAYRQVGVYAGQILKGTKPANLPVVQPAKFELVINLKTAKALGLTVPDKLLALADEVIE